MVNHPKIYAHRGVWALPEDQNSPGAILRASRLGFGVETDIRSKFGKLAISHDPLTELGGLDADLYQFSNIPIALNIKEDGLSDKYSEFLQRYPNEDSFIFDGSLPEMFKIRNSGLPHALRLSEYERQLPWKTKFVWVDAFHQEWWIDSGLIEDLLEKQFLVFVSPELHGRDKSLAWSYLRKLKQFSDYKFGVCTDFPIELREYFCE